MFTLGLLVVAAMQMGITAGQLKTAKKQGDLMKAQGEAMDRQAATMKEQAQLAQAAAALERETTKLELRAYLVVESHDRRQQRADGSEVLYPQIWAVNAGQTPAHDVRVVATVSGPEPTRDELLELTTGEDEYGLLPPRQRVEAHAEYVLKPGDETTFSVRNNRYLFFAGRVSYRDAFGDRWVQTFCFPFRFREAGPALLFKVGHPANVETASR
jgi:hypothetical protein